MKTVGSILKDARTARKISLEQVEKDTKIRKKFLESIELDDYRNLPSLSYAKGFVKNYSDYLGLSTPTVLAFFRRQAEDVPKSILLPQSVSEHLTPSPFRLTPGRFLIVIFLFLAGAFFLYFGLQYRQLTNPPFLVIESPTESQVVHERRVDVVGKTDSDATLTVNGISVIVRGDGRFFDQVLLVEGPNMISVSATSRFGKSSTQTRTVTQVP